MSSDTFTKENLDDYLKEVGKQFRKLNGKTMRAEIILIGGAAIVAHYGFRTMTSDVDAEIKASSSMKDAINYVGDKYGLAYRWLNDDFVKTESYTPKLAEFSRHYRTFANVLDVRTVSAEYLVAMKLCAGREFKHDLSDIVGILAEHEQRGEPITREAVYTAVNNLYGTLDAISPEVKTFFDGVMSSGDYENLYTQVCEQERSAKELLLGFQDNYPGVVTAENVKDVLKSLREKKSQAVVSDVLGTAYRKSEGRKLENDGQQKHCCDVGLSK